MALRQDGLKEFVSECCVCGARREPERAEQRAERETFALTQPKGCSSGAAIFSLLIV